MPELSAEFWIVTIITLIALALGLGVTLAMDAKTKGEFWFAVGCFFVSALMVFGMVIVWGVRTESTFMKRTLIVGFMFFVVGVSLVEAVRWTLGRHQRASVNSSSSLPVSESSPGGRLAATDIAPKPAPPKPSPASPKPSKEEEEGLRIEKEQLALNYIPSVTIIYTDGRVQILNSGRTNVELWAFSYGDATAQIEKESRVIAPSTYYYIFADAIEKQMREHLKNGQQGVTPCYAYITTQDKKKYTIKGSLVGQIINNVLSIQAQTVGSVEGWVNESSLAHTASSADHTLASQVEPSPSPKTTPAANQVAAESIPAQEVSSTKNILGQLALFIDEASQIQARFIGSDNAQAELEEANEWAARVQKFLIQHLDASYAIQFRNSAGSAWMGMPVNHSVVGGGYWQNIEGKKNCLNEFIRDLRQLSQ